MTKNKWTLNEMSYSENMVVYRLLPYSKFDIRFRFECLIELWAWRMLEIPTKGAHNEIHLIVCAFPYFVVVNRQKWIIVVIVIESMNFVAINKANWFRNQSIYGEFWNLNAYSLQFSAIQLICREIINCLSIMVHDWIFWFLMLNIFDVCHRLTENQWIDKIVYIVFTTVNSYLDTRYCNTKRRISISYLYTSFMKFTENFEIPGKYRWQ